MPSNDLVLNVRQISSYTATDPIPGDVVLIQRGGLGGPYQSMTVEDLVAVALAYDEGPAMGVGVAPPGNSASSLIYTGTIVTPFDGLWMWNCYIDNGSPAQTRYFGAGPWGVFRMDPAAGWQFYGGVAGGAGQIVSPQTTQLTISPSGYLQVGEQMKLGRDPAAPMEAATAQWVQGQIAVSNAMLQSLYSTATVWSFNRRVGNIILNLNDVMGAGGAPIWSPQFQGQPTAPTPVPADNSGSIATTAWVWQTLNTTVATGVVSSFNGRTGAITLTAADISGAGGATSSALTAYAPLTSPAFSGTPSAPTAAPGANSGQLATTAFVHAAVTASTSGVASFNTRTGAVVLTTADVTGAGGAVLASPAFTGVPTAPTAAPGTSTTQLATCAFVLGANVTSFNTRIGAITLTGADITSAGGAVLSSPAFTGTPTAPTAAPGTSSGQLATTAFVANVIAGGMVATFNGRTGSVSLIANDVSAAGGALLASPVFTGTPAGPTASPGTNTMQLATTAFVAAALSVAGGVSTFNGRSGAVTLLGGDITGAGGALLASPALTGAPTAPTVASTDNSSAIATTAYVKSAVSQPATVAPLMDGTAAVGTSLLYARQDHVHPHDTTLLPLAGGTLTGALTASAGATINPLTAQGGAMTMQAATSGGASLINFMNLASSSTYGWVGANGGNVLYLNNNAASSYLQLYTDGSFSFSGNGVAYKSGGGSWTAPSDARIKDVVGEYERGLDEVLQLRPVEYVYKGNDARPEGPVPRGGSASGGRHFVGLVAQEVEDIFPDMVAKTEGFIDGKPVSDLRTLDTTPLMFALVNCIKQLASRVAALEAA